MSPDLKANGPRMSDGEFRMFTELLREHCGLHFPPDMRYLLEQRLGQRIQQMGLGSFVAYHYLLRQQGNGGEELSRLIDEVTNNETYFLRERNQLRTLVEEILLELTRDERRASVPAVWSAGCSSGEEPYSVVMMALEAGLEPGRDLRVYASDISRSMLQKARRGIYRPTSLRETGALLRQKYFVEEEGLYRLSDQVKRHVCFAQMNLLDRSRTSVLGTMDVILCRNVIIYFDMETKRRVIQAFAERLRPGGYLLLGHSESLINLSSAFELKTMQHDLVYQKPTGPQWLGSSPTELERERESTGA